MVEVAELVAVVVAAAGVLAVAVTAVEMVMKEAVVAVAAMLAVCIHDNINQVWLGRGSKAPLPGGQGCEPLGRGSKVPLWRGRRTLKNAEIAEVGLTK